MEPSSEERTDPLNPPSQAGPDTACLMPTARRPHAVMVRGEGSWLWDASGRRYLDFVQGWAVNALGHAPACVRAALDAQAGRLLTPRPAYHNAPQLALARRLCALARMDRVFLCATGAEANEGAIKLARKWGRLHRGGAFEIVTTHDAFHGRTLATMAASGKRGWDTLFPPRPEGFRRVPFGDLAAVEAAIGPETAAVMVEPIQGEGGVVVPPVGYLSGLRELTRARGVLLVFDEIQTGLGRTGPLFAFESEAARPDVLTLGKALGGGVPIAALLARGAADCFEPGDQGGTFAGNPLTAAVALAVLDALAEPELRSRRVLGAGRLERVLSGLVDRFGLGPLRGRGHLWALELPRPVAPRVAASAFADEALLVNAPRETLLRMMPALTADAEEVEEMGRRLARVLARHLSAGSAES